MVQKVFGKLRFVGILEVAEMFTESDGERPTVCPTYAFLQSGHVNL
jgi:hypothetical protein